MQQGPFRENSGWPASRGKAHRKPHRAVLKSMMQTAVVCTALGKCTLSCSQCYIPKELLQCMNETKLLQTRLPFTHKCARTRTRRNMLFQIHAFCIRFWVHIPPAEHINSQIVNDSKNHVRDFIACSNSIASLVQFSRDQQ